LYEQEQDGYAFERRHEQLQRGRDKSGPYLPPRLASTRELEHGAAMGDPWHDYPEAAYEAYADPSRVGVSLMAPVPSQATRGARPTAHLPEYFVDRVPCPSTPAARTEFVGQYVSALKRAGINVLDTATLIHSLKGQYDFDLFPQGGVHWNDVGGARAVSALVDEIDRQAGREIVPSFTFTYTLSSAAGADRELVDLLNVFFPPLAYLTPKVKYTTSASCADHPAHLLDIAMVGSSFSHLAASILIEHNCLSRLNLYYYARLGRFGGVPYHELQRNLGEAELRPLRDAKIMILEENEAFAARSGYVDILRDVINKP